MTIYRGGPLVSTTIYVVALPQALSSVEIYENATQIHLKQRGGFGFTQFILWPTILTLTEFNTLFNPSGLVSSSHGTPMNHDGEGAYMSLFGMSRFDLTLAEDRPVGLLYLNIVTKNNNSAGGNLYLNVTQVCRARTM
tara:strand:+ start:2508 stop:2921 length:414 start_codon:yes stop_codon:yes gene_type:complete